MYLQYCAVLEYDVDGINVSFPDVTNAITCGYSRSEAIHMAKEVLEIVLHGEKVSMLPAATPKEKIDVTDSAEIVEITITMQVKDGVLYGFGVRDI